MTVGDVERTERLLDSIVRNSEDAWYRTIIVDNGSSHALSNRLSVWGMYYHGEPGDDWIIHPGSNIGWDKAVNAGLAVSTAPYVVLMNDDTEVRTEGWLEKMRDAFGLPVRVAAVGPDGSRMSFYCVMLSREAILDVGYMDEHFSGGYGGSDNDWLWRAEEKGWACVATNVEVWHEGSATFKERRNAERVSNLDYLRAKWPKKEIW